MAPQTSTWSQLDNLSGRGSGLQEGNHCIDPREATGLQSLPLPLPATFLARLLVLPSHHGLNGSQFGLGPLSTGVKPDQGSGFTEPLVEEFSQYSQRG